ncbi:MAG: lipoyl synthase [Candidatus Brocadiaceae bacterium]|jgi:lipoic acid synthetase
MSKATRFPPWLKKRLPPAEQTQRVRSLLAELHLNTVCRSARCPNRGECYARGTATFMILGPVCTRNCRFCAVEGGTPAPPDPDEPCRVAEAIRRLELRHVVITSVTRDDLPDGGSGHFAAAIRAIREATDATIEVLTPDFLGRPDDVDRVLDAAPDVFNHNVETVPGLYGDVRPGAGYRRSLRVLARAARHPAVPGVKSGLMLGLGETEDEIREVLTDLVRAGCRAVTLGQYLAPSEEHHPVVEFVPPERFARLEELALRTGFEVALSGPFVRSSYRAAQVAEQLLRAPDRPDR